MRALTLPLVPLAALLLTSVALAASPSFAGALDAGKQKTHSTQLSDELKYELVLSTADDAEVKLDLDGPIRALSCEAAGDDTRCSFRSTHPGELRITIEAVERRVKYQLQLRSL